MAAEDIVITFAGITAITEMDMTISLHGIVPSTFTLKFPKQSVPRLGDLTISYKGVFLTLANCIADLVRSDRFTMTLQIKDRRVRWAFGAVIGRFNIRGDAGLGVVLASLRTAQQLAAICLDAMGETGYDVSQLPINFYPEVNWQYVPPAQALNDLVESMGCRVVWNVIDDVVEIWQNGTGASLPENESLLEMSDSLDPAEKPDSIIVLSAPNLYKATFDLEGVGEEATGEVNLWENVSYKPSQGWETQSFQHFFCLQTPENRELAKRSMGKAYRIKIPPGGLSVPGAGFITTLDPIILDTNTTPTSDASGAYASTGRPRIKGKFWRGGFTRAKSTADRDLEVSFSIEPERWLIWLEEPVVQYDPVANEFSPAELQADLYFQVGMPDFDYWIRTIKIVATPGVSLGTPPLFVVRDDIRSVVDLVDGTESTTLVTDAELGYVATGESLKFATYAAQSATYSGLFLLPGDGAVQQMSIVANEGDAVKTSYSLNSETGLISPRYSARNRSAEQRVFSSRVWNDLAAERSRRASRGGR